MTGLSALLRRDRFILGAALLTIAFAAWAYLIYEAHQMTVTGVCECMRMKMAGPDSSEWPAATLLPLFLMWCVMMVAMMLPSAMPMVLTFAAVTRNRRKLGRPYVPATIFVCGYVVTWCAFSAVAAVGQWLLHRHALLSPAMATTSAFFGGALLIGAGIFQFTPLKRSCLTHCRGTLEFILTRWREGRSGAFKMGLEHGAFCTGCCWALMALLFVAGVMNMLWVAALTLLVCLEKILPARARVSFATGIVLAGWGVFILGSHCFALAAS
jgi:predicted metal-binding membrane protein